MVTNEATSYLWERCGFKLNVPKNSLLEGFPEYPVNIKASLTGHFELPEGLELVSAVYWVYVPGKFTKPATIEVQHCANFSHPDQLHFIHANCTQKSLPYKFEVVDGGSFTLGSKYGALSTTKFSGNGIAKEVAPGDHSCQYCAQVYFTVKHLQDFWYCHFVVTKDLDMCLAVSTSNTTDAVLVDQVPWSTHKFFFIVVLVSYKCHEKLRAYFLKRCSEIKEITFAIVVWEDTCMMLAMNCV